MIGHPVCGWALCVRAALAGAALLLCCALFAEAGESGAGGVRVTLLNTRLGDPNNPDNLKLELTLPKAIRASLPEINARNFEVYVLPITKSQAGRLPVKYLARSVLLWQHGKRVYLDVRQPPRQERECAAWVVVRCRSGGVVLAQGRAAQPVRYDGARVDVVLALDASQSMLRSDPHKQRIAAARAFIDLAARGGRIGRIGVLSFHTYPQVHAPLTDVKQIETLRSALDLIGREGKTNMDRALEAALDLIDTGKSNRAAVIFLTDGKNEPGNYKGTHQKLFKRDIPVFTIGLSRFADHALLEHIASETGGRSYRAETGDLMGIYQRLAGEIGKRVLLASESIDQPDKRFAIPVDATVRSLRFLLDGAEDELSFSVQTPRGRTLAASDPEARIAVTRESSYQVVDVLTPGPGTWRLQVTRQGGGEERRLTVEADSPLFLDLFPPQLDDDGLILGATLAQSGVPVTSGRVRVSDADGTVLGELFDDGAHGDGASGDGVFSNRFAVPPALGADVVLQLRAIGGSAPGSSFLREVGATLARTVKVAETDRVTPEPEMAARVMVEPVNFGTRQPGETMEIETRVMLIADGGQPLTVEPEPLESQGVADLPLEALQPLLNNGAQVLPGESLLRLRLTVPASAPDGLYETAFHLRAGDAETSLPIWVMIKRPMVQWDSHFLDFGNLVPGETRTRTLTARVGSVPPVDRDLVLEGDDRDLAALELQTSSLAETGVTEIML